MPYPKSHWITLNVSPNRQERVLNDLEEMASGAYDVVGIQTVTIGGRAESIITVRMTVAEDEPVFDEAEIKRKLGF
jgi:hypothetical protein